MKELLDFFETLGLNQFGLIDIDKINFSDEVRKMCAANSCGKYGTNWMCPPGVGEVADLKVKCLKYKYAMMFNYVSQLEDSFDFEGMVAGGQRFSAVCDQIRSWMQVQGMDFLILGAGGCSFCPTCTYPDAPCRLPDKAMPSVESYGIFVAELAPIVGFKYINGQNTVTNFGIVFF